MSAQPCNISPDCTFGLHAPDAHPCGKRHIPGSPCDYCRKPTPITGGPCPDCWQTITIADFKGLMADAGFDTVVTSPGEGPPPA